MCVKAYRGFESHSLRQKPLRAHVRQRTPSTADIRHSRPAAIVLACAPAVRLYPVLVCGNGLMVPRTLRFVGQPSAEPGGWHGESGWQAGTGQGDGAGEGGEARPVRRRGRAGAADQRERRGVLGAAVHAAGRRAGEMGLGALHTFGLAEAREKARRFRQELHDGIDPLASRQGREGRGQACRDLRAGCRDCTWTAHAPAHAAEREAQAGGSGGRRWTTDVLPSPRRQGRGRRSTPAR